MVADKVAKELRSALDTMKAERDELDQHIQELESMLSKLGAPIKRGPGRPKGSTNKKRGPTKAKRGPGRPPGSGKKKKTTKKKSERNWSPAARKAAAERMKKIWADRRKKSGSKTKK